MEIGGEEDTAARASPAKDLGSACVIGALAMAAMVMSVRLEIPGSIYTAPGLLPLVTSLTLLLMAIMLGLKAVQAGGARGFASASRRASQAYLSSEEGRRSLLLICHKYQDVGTFMIQITYLLYCVSIVLNQ